MSNNKTKDKIIDAAVKLFSQNGYHKTKMDDVAREAGVAKGTLYYNFSGKAGLFAEIIVEGIEMLLSRVKKNVDQEVPLSKNTSLCQLKILIKCTLEIYLKYDKLVMILVNEISSGIDNQAIDLINQSKQKYFDYLNKILETGIRNNEIKKNPPRIITGSINGTMEGSVVTYLNDKDSNLSNEEFIQSVVEFITKGIVK